MADDKLDAQEETVTVDDLDSMGFEDDPDDSDSDSLDAEDQDQQDKQTSQDSDKNTDSPEKSDKTDDTDNKQAEEKAEVKEPEKSDDELTYEEYRTKSEQRIKDLRTGYNKLLSDKRAADQRIRELQEKEKELEIGEFNDDDILDDDEKNELKRVDPDAYQEYLDKEKAYNDKKQEIVNLKQDNIRKAHESELQTFIKDAYGYEFDPEIPLDEQPEEIKALDSEIAKVAQYMRENVQRKGGNGRYFTAEQFLHAHWIVNKDQIIEREKANARAEAAASIQNVQRKGSIFDRMAIGQSKNTHIAKTKDFSADEIDSMGEADLDNLLD